MDIIKTSEALAEIVSKNNLGSIKIKTEQVEISIESCVTYAAPLAPIGPAVQSAPVAAAAATVTAAATAETAPVKTGNFVTSPLVGTFYTAPGPDKPPFVKPGDKVTKGQVVCIVESMKIMNEITTDFDGTVAAVLAMDGDSVDFGKELVEII